LDRIVDIHEACTEFFNQHEHKEFHFLCSDENCRHTRKGGVRVTAVNYYRLPTEQIVSPHYRKLKLDQHSKDCYWEQLERALQEEDDAISIPTETEKARRRLARKVKLLVTKFTIPTEEITESTGSKITSEFERIRKISDPVQRNQALRQYARGQGASASSLEDLVSCYEELKELDELKHAFTVEGHGKFTFHQAFRHAKWGSTSRFAIFHGGARPLTKRYGKGFVLKFIDTINDKPISIYVSPNDIRGYRPSARMVKMIDDIETLPNPKPYVRVYWIGSLEDGEKGWNATFKSLAHVVLRVVPSKGAVRSGETEKNLPGAG
jgi:hypothetical protein